MTIAPDPSETHACGLPQVYLTGGTLWCGTAPTVVSTVLGSCISVCLVDRHNRAAGMNHYVLPLNPAGADSLRYGEVALDRLLERMVQLGCAPHELRAKLFGGASVLPFGDSDTVGARNERTALDWLRVHSIPVLARRTGGKHGLLVRFNTGSGDVLVRRVISGAGAFPTGHAPSYDSLHLGGAHPVF
jgi:chemotaxis protein CheD